MLKKGDKVIVTHERLEIYNREMTVKIPHHVLEYSDFIGSDHIVVEDEEGNTLVVTSDQYRLKDSLASFDNINSGDNFNNIKPTDWIKLKKKDNGSQKLFYAVINSYDNGVTYIDDFGNKIGIPINFVEKVDISDAFSYINDLDNQMHILQTTLTEMGNLISDDVKHCLDKVNK